MQSAWQHNDVNFEQKSGFQCFKQITIWSWNKGDMANWSNDAQRACCYGPNSFWIVRAEFGASSWAQFLVAIGPFGFSILTNPIFGCRVIFGNLDFIQILVTKYASWSLKVMGKVSIYYSLVFIICYWLIAYAALRYFGILSWK